MNVLSLIPARGGSKGVPRKNIRNFCGRPLISYAIQVARSTSTVNRVIVSTDDLEIARVAREWGAEVPFIRPESLSGDRVPDFPVIEHAVLWSIDQGWYPDVVVFLRPTQVFRQPEQVGNAIQKLLAHPDLDSIRAISPAAYPPYWMKKTVGEQLVSFLESPFEYSPRQELPPVYQGNGTIEVIRPHAILKKRTLYGDKIGFLEMDEIARVDIDTEIDFKIAEYLYPLWSNGELK